MKIQALIINHPYRFYLTLFVVTFALFKLLPEEGTEHDARGRTPLFLAAEHGDLKTVKRLLTAGVRADECDDCLWTPMMKAAQNGHVEIVRLLLAHGADVNATDKGGYSAVMVAAGDNRPQVIELLARYGANLDHQDHSMGWSALIWAAKDGHHESIMALLKAGANTEIKDQTGTSAGQWAESREDDEIASILSRHDTSSPPRH